MSNEQRILESYFKSNSIVKHQLDPYNHLITFGLQEIIDQDSTIDMPNYTVKFGQIGVSRPQVIEDDRSIYPIYPADARLRNLSYDSSIFLDIYETIDGTQKYHPRVVIGRIPVMLKSSICNLFPLSDQECVQKGECPNDPGGYFIIKGHERVLVGQFRNAYNHVFVQPQKHDSKHKYMAGVRSMSESTGHSILVRAFLNKDERTLLFSLPYIKEPIPVGVVFKALGYTNPQDIIDFIGLDDPQAEKFFKFIIRDSFFCSTKEEALAYIGKYTLTVTPDNRRSNYAWQIVENETLPHLGISGSTKEQACFLGSIVKKLLLVQLGYLSVEEDERDNYSYKRLDVSGMLLYDIIRNLYKKFMTEIRKQLSERKQRPDIIAIISRIKHITKGIHQCMSTGNWVVQKNSTYVKTGVSQILDRMTYLSFISHLRRAIIPTGKEGKNAAMRQLHGTSFGSICPCECFAPDTPILTWNGYIISADQVKVGTVLIDDNGYPVSVRSTISGISEMYTIKHNNPQFLDYTVTSNHILTLKATFHKKITGNTVYVLDRNTLTYEKHTFPTRQDAVIFHRRTPNDDVIDLSIEEYLKLPSSFTKTLKMFKVPFVNWGYTEPAIPSKQFLEDIYKNGTKEYDTANLYAYIMSEYVTNSKKIRLQFLADYIDIFPSTYNKDSIYFYPDDNDREQLIFTVLESLCRSLGLIVDWNENGMSISGYMLWEIPSKKFNLISLSKNTVLTTSFILSRKPTAPFVGWQLNGNGRFLLGDYTVTHNTPEGQKVGTVLNLSLTASVTKKIPTILVRKVLDNCHTISSVDDTKISDIKHLTPVFLNGSIVGYTENPQSTKEELFLYRKSGSLDKEVSISYDNIENQFRIYCDEGRFIRPLLTLTNNKLNIEFGKSKYNWEKLLKKDIVRYVDVAEIEQSVIAMYPSYTDIQKNDYCEIHPSLMLGILASMIPFPDHSQSPRNCYQCLWVEETVLMADGTKKRIADISVGDRVITVDPISCERSETTVINQYVSHTNKQIVKVKLLSNRDLTCTYDHPILTSVGWKKAIQLCTEDLVCVCPESKIQIEYFEYIRIHNPTLTYSEWCKKVVVRNHSIFVPVKEVEVLPYSVMISDITVSSEPHSFITGNNICVHNSSMGKQALGMPCLSYNVRTDTILHVLYYPQRPIVTTMACNVLGVHKMPSGINAIVAIACYQGFNQEDSVICNGSSIDRGLFCLTSYHTIECCEKKRDTYSTEEICLPPLNSDQKIKAGEPGYFKRKSANYNLLDKNGIVRLRDRGDTGNATRVKKGDVLVGKVIITGDKTGKETKVDASVVVQAGEEGIVDRIHILTTPSGYKLVKIVIRVVRTPIIGDKLASYVAQKGTIGMIFRQEDMPFTASGITPDIIMNPLAMPSQSSGLRD